MQLSIWRRLINRKRKDCPSRIDTYIQKTIFTFVIFAWCTEISQETAVNPVDIVSTLQSLQMLKYWKGKHLVLKRQVRDTGPFISFFVISLNNFTVTEFLNKRQCCRIPTYKWKGKRVSFFFQSNNFTKMDIIFLVLNVKIMWFFFFPQYTMVITFFTPETTHSTLI